MLQALRTQQREGWELLVKLLQDEKVDKGVHLFMMVLDDVQTGEQGTGVSPMLVHVVQTSRADH